MKKGSTGKGKRKNSPSGKAGLSTAKSRIKKLLAKAKTIVVFEKPSQKVSSPKSKIKSPVKIQRKSLLKRNPVVPEKTSAPAYTDLPFSHNQTKLALLVRDPEWAYAYWDFSGETWTWVTKLFEADPASRAKLRIHNLSHQTSYDLDVQLETKNWYVNFGLPDTEFQAELGLLDSKGRFYSIVKSNRVKTPRNGPSGVIDPLWDPSEFATATQVLGKPGEQSAASFFSFPGSRKF